MVWKKNIAYWLPFCFSSFRLKLGNLLLVVDTYEKLPNHRKYDANGDYSQTNNHSDQSDIFRLGTICRQKKKKKPKQSSTHTLNKDAHEHYYWAALTVNTFLKMITSWKSVYVIFSSLLSDVSSLLIFHAIHL